MAKPVVLLTATGLFLSACSPTGEEPADEGVVASADEDSLIACAIGTASEFTRNCAVERSIEQGVLMLTIHHENGSFRRLRVMGDGSGVTSADGADEAQITVFDGEIEVALGGDRYLLPATITGNGEE